MSLIPNCKIPVQTICFLQLVFYHSYFTHREPFSKGFLYQSSRSYQNSVKNTLFRPYPMYSLLLTSSYSFCWQTMCSHLETRFYVKADVVWTLTSLPLGVVLIRLYLNMHFLQVRGFVIWIKFLSQMSRSYHTSL